MINDTRFAITGATGFVGQALCQHLNKNYISYTALVREGSYLPPHLPTQNTRNITDLNDFSRLTVALQGVECVVHLAAKVHQMSVQNLNDYLDENLKTTQTLLKAANDCGVKHFIFISTVKVYGDVHLPDVYINTPCRPDTPYGKSKLAAEEWAISFCRDHNIALDILRIPLVLAPHAKGNISRLQKLIALQLPLPFKNFLNPRSYVHLNKLVSTIAALGLKKDPGIRRHLISDEPALSTQELLYWLASSQNKTVSLFSVPQSCWKILAKIGDVLKSWKIPFPFDSDAYAKLYEKHIVHASTQTIYNPLQKS